MRFVGGDQRRVGLGRHLRIEVEDMEGIGHDGQVCARPGALRQGPHRALSWKCEEDAVGDVPPGADGGIGAVREMLGSKPRPVGWEQRRARIDEVGSAWPIATDIRLTAVDVDGLTGEWSLAPDADDGSALLFFHGGGYASGSILSHRSMVTEAGRAAGIRTLAVEYRRSPEYPFPTAVDDAVRAWDWLRASGLDADRIVLGGDSAGGGLVLAVWQRLRDAGEPGPAALWLVSPWTDLTLSGESLDLKDAVDPLLHRAYLAELAAA